MINPLNVNSEKVFATLKLLLFAIAFSFPFGRKYTSPLLIVLFVIFAGYLVVTRKRIRADFPSTAPGYFLLFPVGFYLLYAVGLVQTTNLKHGIFELDIKITLLVLPILFHTIQSQLLPADVEKILKSFLLGMLACASISIGLGFYNSISFNDGQMIFRTAVNDVSYERHYSFFEQVTQGGNYFFGKYISPFITTIYYGIYLSMGVLIAGYFFIKTRSKRYIALAVALFIVLVFCDSRGPLLSFAITLLLVSLMNITNKVVRVLFPMVVAAVIFIFAVSPRVSLLLEDVQDNYKNAGYHTTESTALRLVVWRTAFEIISEEWLAGVGPGDREDIMLAKTKQVNKFAYEQKLNAHNQYMDTFISLGIAGFLALVLMLFVPLMHCIRNQKLLTMVFLALIALNAMVESLLQVFQGIVFFSFFYCLLVGYGGSNSTPSNLSEAKQT